MYRKAYSDLQKERGTQKWVGTAIKSGKKIRNNTKRLSLN